MKTKKLTVSDRARAKRHRELVQIVKDNYETFNRSRFALGGALIELHDGGYWKDTHTTFKDYCEENFSISDNYARRLMDGAKTKSDLPKSWQSAITTESQARVLSTVPKESRVEVLEEASKNGHITAKSIEDAASKIDTSRVIENVPIGTDRVSVKSGSKSTFRHRKIHYDKIGTPLPDDAIPWGDKDGDHVKALNAVLKLIRDAKKIVLDGRKLDNWMWMKLSNTIESDFSYLYFLIKEAYPHAVCTTCQGSPSMQPEGCSYCHNTGLISKRNWDTASMKELKEIRMRSNYDHAKTHPDSPLNKAQEPEED